MLQKHILANAQSTAHSIWKNLLYVTTYFDYDILVLCHSGRAMAKVHYNGVFFLYIFPFEEICRSSRRIAPDVLNGAHGKRSCRGRLEAEVRHSFRI